MSVSVDVHRWYAVVYDGDQVVSVLSSTLDGIEQFGTMEEYEEAYE